MATTPRNELIEALAAVFRREGYTGASITTLAAAAGLGKATLYHHFPGGKEAMADAVLAAAAAELDRRAYRKLRKNGRWNERIAAYVTGFGRYVEDGARNCLFVALTASGSNARLSGDISRRTEDWLQELTAVFAESGQTEKRARRSARELLGQLYGALAIAQLTGDPKVYRQAAKRLLNQLNDGK